MRSVVCALKPSIAAAFFAVCTESVKPLGIWRSTSNARASDGAPKKIHANVTSANVTSALTHEANAPSSRM